MGRLRMELANIIGRRQPRRSRDLAGSGLLYLPDGPNAAQLHLHYGRAAARLGDAEAARGAIISATEVRQRDVFRTGRDQPAWPGPANVASIRPTWPGSAVRHGGRPHWSGWRT
jgi:hypothetical protein